MDLVSTIPTGDGTPDPDLLQRLDRMQRIMGEDAQLQAAMVDFSAVERIAQAGNTTIERLCAIFKQYPERTCFGIPAKAKPEWRLVTYKDVWDRIQMLVAGWKALGMVGRGQFVGIMGFASMDWVVSDIATTYTGGIMSPLPTNILVEDIKQLILEAEVNCLMCSPDEMGKIAPIVRECTCLSSIVIMDSTKDDMAASGAYAELKSSLSPGCKLMTMEEVLDAGRQAGSVPEPAIPGRDGYPENPLMHLMYTSGSSGRPKGAEYTERHYCAFLNYPFPPNAPRTAAVQLGFLPLNHLMGRMTLLKCLITGGQCYFTRSLDMSTFLEDMRLIRPTEMLAPPRITSMMYDHFQEVLGAKSASSPPEDREQQRQELIEEFREKELGGRVFSCTTGSAPSAPEVLAWLGEVLGFPVVNGYGSTECGVTLLNNKVVHKHCTGFKLVDVPELGYSTQDKPYPRGELRVKTKLMIPGYFKHPKATAELYDEEGFQRTGDVCEQQGLDTFVWIDRVSNIIKLSQGEYVSVSRLEALYAANSPSVHQMYLYGNSLRAYLVAIVVAQQEAKGTVDEAELRSRIRTEIDNVARHKSLQGYEIPREFIIEWQPFTKANHLITDSNKMARGQLKKRYQAKLEALYTALEERQKERLRSLKEGTGGTVTERVKQALEVTLGLADGDMTGVSGRSFAQLGGDSLAAVQFARHVSELCGVNLPVSYVLDHSHSLQAIIDHVEELVGGSGGSRISFQDIHRGNTAVIRAADLQLERFLSEEDLRRARSATSAAQLPAQPQVALLTGANGFLGRFLLLELLQTVSKHAHGMVHAIVRAKSGDEAWERLRGSYNTGDTALLELFDGLSKDHLSVHAGDLARPNLGLDQDVYQQLCSNVDTIIHNGALVNHAYSYEQLFEPNVLGTIEVMRLALTQRRKALGFVSSVGIMAGISHPEPVLESEDALSLCAEHAGDGSYAMGYGCTKWACEVLLRQLHEQHDIPVRIFRCSMILAHPKYVGQINTTDFFTRLLCGIAYTGIAPQSFYTSPNGSRPHFDGTPVDVVSGVIAATVAHERSGFATYHVVNPHYKDGISLDTIAAWLASAGIKVEHVAPYERWYERFKAALESLKSKQQQQASPLPIIYQWQRPQPAHGAQEFDATELRSRAKQYTQWPDMPHLDETFIAKNVQHLTSLGLITNSATS